MTSRRGQDLLQGAPRHMIREDNRLQCGGCTEKVGNVQL